MSISAFSIYRARGNKCVRWQISANSQLGFFGAWMWDVVWPLWLSRDIRHMAFRLSLVSFFEFYCGLKSIIVSFRYIFGIPVCIVSSRSLFCWSFGSAEQLTQEKRNEIWHPGDHLSAINLLLLLPSSLTYKFYWTSPFLRNLSIVSVLYSVPS